MHLAATLAATAVVALVVPAAITLVVALAAITLVSVTLAVPLLATLAGGALAGGVVTPAALAALAAALAVLLALGPPGALSGTVGGLGGIGGARREGELAVGAVGLGVLSGLACRWPVPGRWPALRRGTRRAVLRAWPWPLPAPGLMTARRGPQGAV